MSSGAPTFKKENPDILATVESELDRWRNILFFSMDNREGPNNETQPLIDPDSHNFSSDLSAETHGQQLSQPRHITSLYSATNAPYEPHLNAYHRMSQETNTSPLESQSLQFDSFQPRWRPAPQYQGSNPPANAHHTEHHPVASTSHAGSSGATSMGEAPPTTELGNVRRLRSQSASGGASYASRSKASGSELVTTVDHVGQLEEKRKRNTEASARFRLKKKERNLNLEQTISELSGRAEELEKEAENLRRENGWLKEIVVMRSRAQREDQQKNQEQEQEEQEEEDQEEDKASSKKRK